MTGMSERLAALFRCLARIPQFRRAGSRRRGLPAPASAVEEVGYMLANIHGGGYGLVPEEIEFIQENGGRVLLDPLPLEVAASPTGMRYNLCLLAASTRSGRGRGGWRKWEWCVPKDRNVELYT